MQEIEVYPSQQTAFVKDSLMVRILLGVILFFTGITGYFVLSHDDGPKLSLGEARGVFERYPYWQANVFDSDTVVYDPSLAVAFEARFETPDTLGDDPYMIWAPERRKTMMLEIGAGRLTGVPVAPKE